MFKQRLLLEVQGQNDRMYRLECPPESPAGEIFDAVCVMRAHILEKMNEITSVDEKEPAQDCEKEEDQAECS